MKRLFCSLFLLFLFLNPVFCKEKKTIPIQTVEEWKEMAKDVPRYKRDIPSPIGDYDLNSVILPEPKILIVKYNDPPGGRVVDLSKIIQKRQISSLGVASPDYKKMAFVNYYYFPLSNEISSELFLIPLDQAKTNKVAMINAHMLDTDMIPVFQSGMDDIIQNLSQTLEIVDFSKNSEKILLKEKIGSREDGLWQTNIWIYDVIGEKAKKYTSVQNQIMLYWLKKGVALRDYRWDVTPLGFSAQNPNVVIISAFAYSDSKPKNLGAWALNVENGGMSILSLNETSFDIEINGFCLKSEIDPLAPKPRQVQAWYKQTLKRKKLERYEKILEQRQKRGQY